MGLRRGLGPGVNAVAWVGEHNERPRGGACKGGASWGGKPLRLQWQEGGKVPPLAMNRGK